MTITQSLLVYLLRLKQKKQKNSGYISLSIMLPITLPLKLFFFWMYYLLLLPQNNSSHITDLTISVYGDKPCLGHYIFFIFLNPYRVKFQGPSD